MTGVSRKNWVLFPAVLVIPQQRYAHLGLVWGFFFFVLSDLNGAAGLDILILELLSDMGCLFQELKLSGSLVC